MALALSYVGSIRAAISYTLPALIRIRFASRSFREDRNEVIFFRYRLINPVKNFLLLLSYVKCQSIHCVIPVFPIRTTRENNQSGTSKAACNLRYHGAHFFSRGTLKPRLRICWRIGLSSQTSRPALPWYFYPQFHSLTFYKDNSHFWKRIRL